MKILFLVILFSVVGKNYGAVVPIISEIVAKAEETTILQDSTSLDIVADNFVSCRSINLRLQRLEELSEELNFVRFLQDNFEMEMLAYMGIKQFIISQGFEYYVLNLDQELHTLEVSLQKVNYSENDLVMTFLAGENKLSFVQANELEFGVDSLKMKMSNYQYCLDPRLTLIVVKNCRVTRFSELGECLNSSVLRYDFDLPEFKLQNGALRRSRW